MTSTHNLSIVLGPSACIFCVFAEYAMSS